MARHRGIPDLPAGDEGGRHVQDDGKVVPGRDGDRDGVGADQRRFGAVNGHRRGGVGEDAPHHPFLKRHHGVVRRNPEVIRILDRHDTGAVEFRLVDASVMALCPAI